MILRVVGNGSRQRLGAQRRVTPPLPPFRGRTKKRTLCGERHHMGLSRGLVRNGSVRAVNGPLAGKEALIRKLDLHKRIAVLNLKPVKENKDIWAGIEILPGE